MHVLAQKDGAVQSESSRSSRVAISGIEDMLPLRAPSPSAECMLFVDGQTRAGVGTSERRFE